MKTKFIHTAVLALLIVSAGVVGAAQIHRLEARTRTLENAQSVQLARVKVILNALERAEAPPVDVLASARMLAAVLEPGPQAAQEFAR